MCVLSVYVNPSLYVNVLCRLVSILTFTPVKSAACSVVTQWKVVLAAAESTNSCLSLAVLMVTTLTLSKMRKRLAVWMLPARSSAVRSTAYTPDNIYIFILYMYKYVYIYICMYVYIYVYIYIYIIILCEVIIQVATSGGLGQE